jgi:uncharacterized repeat protein (TIGR02543 family)
MAFYLIMYMERSMKKAIIMAAALLALVLTGCRGPAYGPGGDDGGNPVTPPSGTTYTLTTNVSPAGGGTVTRSPDQASYASGTQVIVKAVAASGYTFTGWSGASSSTSASLSVTMSRDISLTANFQPNGGGGGELDSRLVNASGEGWVLCGYDEEYGEEWCYAYVFESGGGVSFVEQQDTWVTSDAGTWSTNNGDLTIAFASGYGGTVSYAISGSNLTFVYSNGEQDVFVKKKLEDPVVTPPQNSTYTLTTNVSPAGGGTVSRSPNQASYNAGTQVTVTATAASGYTFTGWSGASSSTSASVTVTMNSNLTLTANFQASGGGTLDSRLVNAANEAWVECGYDGGVEWCWGVVFQSSGAYLNVYMEDGVWENEPGGTWLTNNNKLTLDYGDGSTTMSYSISGSTLTIVDDSSGETIVFTKRAMTGGTPPTPTTYTLTTNVSPAGGGTVSRSPNQASYNAGTQVTVTATPASGYTFTGWSGASSSTSASVTVTMNSNLTLTANFQQQQVATYTLTTSVSPTGGGTVSRSPNQASYNAGTQVTVTATPASGYTFTGWSGASSSTSASVTVTMNSNLTLTANFQTSGGGTLDSRLVNAGTDGWVYSWYDEELEWNLFVGFVFRSDGAFLNFLIAGGASEPLALEQGTWYTQGSNQLILTYSHGTYGYTYSVSGNSLTLVDPEDGYTEVYQRQYDITSAPPSVSSASPEKLRKARERLKKIRRK